MTTTKSDESGQAAGLSGRPREEEEVWLPDGAGVFAEPNVVGDHPQRRLVYIARLPLL
jgi:hypothetical protein